MFWYLYPSFHSVWAFLLPHDLGTTLTLLILLVLVITHNDKVITHNDKVITHNDKVITGSPFMLQAEHMTTRYHINTAYLLMYYFTFVAMGLIIDTDDNKIYTI